MTKAEAQTGANADLTVFVEDHPFEVERRVEEVLSGVKDVDTVNVDGEPQEPVVPHANIELDAEGKARISVEAIGAEVEYSLSDETDVSANKTALLPERGLFDQVCGTHRRPQQDGERDDNYDQDSWHICKQSTAEAR